MRMVRAVGCGFLVAGLCVGASGAGAQATQGTGGRLDETLRKLDASSAVFKSAQANFHKELYTFPIPDPDLQDGSIYFLRQGGAYSVGAKILGKQARTMQYSGSRVKIYNPAIKCFDELSGAGNQSKIESFLTLGFGGSGRELEKAWTIQDFGQETLQSEGKAVKVEKLGLAPKDASVKNLVKTMTLWMDLERGVSIKQELISPSGDKQTAIYSGIRLNEKVDTKPFEFPESRCGKK